MQVYYCRGGYHIICRELKALGVQLDERIHSTMYLEKADTFSYILPLLANFYNGHCSNRHRKETTGMAFAQHLTQRHHQS